MNINWDEMPCWADVWIESLAAHVKSNWAKESGDKYIFKDLSFVQRLEKPELYIAHYPPKQTSRIDQIGQNGNDGVHYDMVNHPPHYQSQNGIECIEAIRAQLTEEEFRGYCKGNCIKYIWRERQKGGDESVKKAVWYLNQLDK